MKNKIKITIRRGIQDYYIVKITGAITVSAKGEPVLRVGDLIKEETAVDLANKLVYEVTTLARN